METNPEKIKSILNLDKYLINDISNIIILYYLCNTNKIKVSDFITDRVAVKQFNYYNIGKILYDIKFLYYYKIITNSINHTRILIGILENGLYFYLKYKSYIFCNGDYDYNYYQLLQYETSNIIRNILKCL